jgi:hypothetical protein
MPAGASGSSWKEHALSRRRAGTGPAPDLFKTRKGPGPRPATRGGDTHEVVARNPALRRRHRLCSRGKRFRIRRRNTRAQRRSVGHSRRCQAREALRRRLLRRGPHRRPGQHGVLQRHHVHQVLQGSERQEPHGRPHLEGRSQDEAGHHLPQPQRHVERSQVRPRGQPGRRHGRRLRPAHACQDRHEDRPQPDSGRRLRGQAVQRAERHQHRREGPHLLHRPALSRPRARDVRRLRGLSRRSRRHRGAGRDGLRQVQRHPGLARPEARVHREQRQRRARLREHEEGRSLAARQPPAAGVGPRRRRHPVEPARIPGLLEGPHPGLQRARRPGGGCRRQPVGRRALRAPCRHRGVFARRQGTRLHSHGARNCPPTWPSAAANLPTPCT